MRIKSVAIFILVFCISFALDFILNQLNDRLLLDIYSIGAFYVFAYIDPKPCYFFAFLFGILQDLCNGQVVGFSSLIYLFAILILYISGFKFYRVWVFVFFIILQSFLRGAVSLFSFINYVVSNSCNTKQILNHAQ